MKPPTAKISRLILWLALAPAARLRDLETFGKGTVRRAIRQGWLKTHRIGVGNGKYATLTDPAYGYLGQRKPHASASGGTAERESIIVNVLRLQEGFDLVSPSEAFPEMMLPPRFYARHDGKIYAIFVPGLLAPASASVRLLVDYRAECLTRPCRALVERGEIHALFVFEYPWKVLTFEVLTRRARSDDRKLAVAQLKPKAIVVQGIEV